jgi:hypothetical protein
MKKTENLEKTIINFFKPYFKRYPPLDSFWFIMHDLDINPKIYLSDEEYAINEIHRTDLSDEILLDASNKINEVIDILNESNTKINISNLLTNLKLISKQLQKSAEDKNPLNNILKNIWNDETRKSLTQKLKIHAKEEIDWKHIAWVKFTVRRNGTIRVYQEIIPE